MYTRREEDSHAHLEEISYTNELWIFVNVYKPLLLYVLVETPLLQYVWLTWTSSMKCHQNDSISGDHNEREIKRVH